MSPQISLAVPDPLLEKLRARTREQGFRSVQEQILQMIRDQFFLDNLDRYKRIEREMGNGKRHRMSVDEFRAWSRGLRELPTMKSSGIARKPSGKRR